MLQAKRRRLSPLGAAPSDPDPATAALAFATAGHLPLPLAALQQQPAAPAIAALPRLPFVAAPVDWAALAGTLADRAALLAAADAEAAQAAALPAGAAPGSEACDPHQPSHLLRQQHTVEEDGDLEQDDEEEEEEEEGEGDEQQQQQQPAAGGAAAAVAAGGEGRERLEPSSCYRGVWRVLSGPEAGRFKAQISTPGRAGRPKRLGYFDTAMAAAQCYDR